MIKRLLLAILILLTVALIGAKPSNWCEARPTHPKCAQAPTPTPSPLPTDPWTLVFYDDFTTDIPLGSFPATNTTSGPWGSYPAPWSDTFGYSTRDSSRTVSVANGVLTKWLHDGYGAAIMPNTPDAGYGIRNQLYGRYEIRLRTTATADYGLAYLLWPKSEVWPRDGEIDFPEGRLNGTIHGYVHHQGATGGGDQYAVDSGAAFTDWHTTVIEWTPDSVAFYLDGTLVGRETERVPNTPMRLVLQSESFAYPAPDALIEIDYVKVSRYTP